MSHILDIQPHHPHYPPTPGPDSRPSPSASHQPGQTGAAMLHYLTGWLAGWSCLVEEGMHGGKGGCGRETERERGQGCFLFSQLIDSQMSGGVGFVAGLKHPGTLFPSTNKHNTHAHAGEDCARGRAHARTRTCGLRFPPLR